MARLLSDLLHAIGFARDAPRSACCRSCADTGTAARRPPAGLRRYWLSAGKSDLSGDDRGAHLLVSTQRSALEACHVETQLIGEQTTRRSSGEEGAPPASVLVVPYPIQDVSLPIVVRIRAIRFRDFMSAGRGDLIMTGSFCGQLFTREA
jgi:hypothetical protein